MENRINAHTPWITLMVLVTIESSLEGFRLPLLGLHIEDKIVHFIIFGILGWLLIRGFTMESKTWIRQNAYRLAFFTGFLFGVSDELHQLMVPGRSSSVWDLLADTLGILLFIWLFRQKQKRQRPDMAI